MVAFAFALAFLGFIAFCASAYLRHKIDQGPQANKAKKRRFKR